MSDSNYLKSVVEQKLQETAGEPNRLARAKEVIASVGSIARMTVGRDSLPLKEYFKQRAEHGPLS